MRLLCFFAFAFFVSTSTAGAASGPANDAFVDATFLAGDTGTQDDVSFGATKEPGEPDHAGDPGGASVWYRWTAPADGMAGFDVAGDFPALLAVYVGDDVAKLTPVAADAKGAVSFDAAAGTEYRVAVDGSGGATGKFTLHWSAAAPPPTPPVNDALADALALAGASGALVTSTALATLEPGEPDHGGGATVWYRWTAPADGPVTFGTAGSDFPTFIAAYASPDLAKSEIAADAQSITFDAVAGAEYLVQVGGIGGATGTLALSWDQPVVFATNDAFADALVLDGDAGRVALSTLGATKEPGEPDHAGEKGGASLWYRWTAASDGPVTFVAHSTEFGPLLGVYQGDAVDALVTIGGAEGNWPTVTFFAAKGAEYRIAVDGIFGRQGPATLAWGPRPANDDFVAATPLDGDEGATAGSNVGATSEPGEPATFDAPSVSLWFLWTATASGAVTFDPTGSDFLVGLAVFTGDKLDALTPINDFLGPVTFDAEAGQTYVIALVGAGGAMGDYALSWSIGAPPPNDDLANAEPIAGPEGGAAGTNRGATHEPGEPLHAGQEGGGSVWYRWLAPETGRFTFSTRGSGFTTVLAAYTAGAKGDLTEVAANVTPFPEVDPVAVPDESRLAFDAEEGVEYLLAVDGVGPGDRGVVALYWMPTAPNDDFADAVALDGDAGSLTGTTLGATREAGEPERPTSSPATVWYLWTAPHDGAYRFDTRGSQRYFALAVHAGDELDGLSPVADDDATRRADSDFPYAALTFVATAGQTYAIDVESLCTFGGGGFGAALTCTWDGEFTLRWQFLPPPAGDDFDATVPVAGESGLANSDLSAATREAGEPDHAGVPGGASVWFRWTAPRSGRFTFDAMTPFARDRLLDVYTGDKLDALTPVVRTRLAPIVYPPALPEDLRHGVATFDAVAGTEYRIAVDAAAPATIYERLPVVLRWAPSPANDDFADAVPIAGLSGRIDGTTWGATSEGDEYSYATVWYRWTAPVTGYVRFLGDSTDFYADVTAWTGDAFEKRTPVEYRDSPYGSITFAVEAGHEYFISAGGAIVYGDSYTYYGLIGSEVFPFTLSWTPVPTNDAFADAQAIGGAEGAVDGFTSSGSREPGEPAQAGQADGASVWYRFTVPEDGVFRFSVDGDFPAVVGLFRGDFVDGLKSVLDGENGLGPPGSASVLASAGETIAVGVAGLDGTEGRFTLRWSEPTPSVSVGDVFPLPESDGLAGFFMSLSFPSGRPVSVDFATADDTARAGEDYVATRTTVTFPPGVTDTTVLVPVVDDGRDEEDVETFFARLSNPQGVTIGRAEGVATILDDDPQPSLAIGDVRVARGDTARFVVSLSAPSGHRVTVAAATADGSAVAAGRHDYEATRATLVFEPGVTRREFDVPVRNGARLDGTFSVVLSAPTAATLADARGVATITRR